MDVRSTKYDQIMMLIKKLNDFVLSKAKSYLSVLWWQSIVLGIYLTYFVQPLRSGRLKMFRLVFKSQLDPHSCSEFDENMSFPWQLSGFTSIVKLRLQSSISPDSHSRPIMLGRVILKLWIEFHYCSLKKEKKFRSNFLISLMFCGIESFIDFLYSSTLNVLSIDVELVVFKIESRQQ